MNINEQYLDWCATNALRSYPIREDEATAQLPRGLIVDMSVFVADPTVQVRLASVRRSSAVVSLVLTDQHGTAVAVLTRASTTLPAWEPIELESMHPAVHGTVTFGAVERVGEFTYRGSLALDFRALFYTPVTPVTSVKALGASDQLRGLVKLEAGGYLRLVPNEVTRTIRFELDASPEIITLLSGPCIDDAPGSCLSPQGRSLSGVPADLTGTINLVFRNANN